jgi:hypothetical protein
LRYTINKLQNNEGKAIIKGRWSFMLEREDKFYMEHQAEFKEKYPDKWLVIVGESLWGVYDKVSDAAREALQNFGTKEFMLHRPADDDAIIEVGPFASVIRPDDGPEAEPKSTTAVFDGELIAFPYAH